MKVRFLAFSNHYGSIPFLLEKNFDVTLELIKQKTWNSGEITPLISSSCFQYNIVYYNPELRNNENLLTLFLTLHLLKKSSSIILILPFFNYTRHDKDHSFLKGIITILNSFSINHIITIDWHNPKTLSWFTSPTTNLQPVINKKELTSVDYVIAPDKGSKERAYKISEPLEAMVFACQKKRSPKLSIKGEENTNILRGKNCLIIDDILDSGNTLIETVRLIKKASVKSINVFVTHCLADEEKLHKIFLLGIEKFFITNSIPNSFKRNLITVLDNSFLIGKGIEKELKIIFAKSSVT